MSDLQEQANLAEMVRARAQRRGDAIAFEFEGRRTSFAEFDVNTNKVANALIAMGVRPGERIAYRRRRLQAGRQAGRGDRMATCVRAQTTSPRARAAGLA